MQSKPKVISIYGPTISKKTGLALNIAKYVWGKHDQEARLISADSKKFYYDLKIGQVDINEKDKGKFDVKLTKFLAADVPITLYDYKKLADHEIDLAHKNRQIPIVFGGTGIYHISVLENWFVPEEYDPRVDHELVFGKNAPKYDYIVLVPKIYNKVLFSAIKRHIEQHFRDGICNELLEIIVKYKIDIRKPDRWNIIFETIGYKEFIDYSNENTKDISKLNNRDLRIIKANMFKNLKDMARQQIRFCKKFKNIHIVSDWKHARYIVDEFLNQ